ncbi:3510_t:CDS:2, partial [Cetraspora pellucida]
MKKSPATFANQEVEQDNIAHAEVDYIDIRDFIEHKIQKLINNKETTYQTHLLVHIDVAVQDMTLKEVADLVIVKVGNRDNYSWKTAREWYELYAIVVDVEGARFPIAYLVINTTK